MAPGLGLAWPPRGGAGLGRHQPPGVESLDSLPPGEGLSSALGRRRGRNNGVGRVLGGPLLTSPLLRQETPDRLSRTAALEISCSAQGGPD